MQDWVKEFADSFGAAGAGMTFTYESSSDMDGKGHKYKRSQTTVGKNGQKVTKSVESTKKNRVQILAIGCQKFSLN